MKKLFLIAYLDVKESLRSKWFYLYTLIFGGLMAMFFIAGVSDSVVLGFTGLTRLLLIFIEITIIILPIFILVTTVKSISGDRESNVLEYMLSFPISLKDYYYGKFIGRFFTVFVPIVFALVMSIIFGLIKGGNIPWSVVILYTILVFAMCFVFLGIAFFVSTIVKSSDIAVGSSFVIWIVLLAFIDVGLIGLMLQHRVDTGVIIGIALLNPVEVFRVAALSLFDPQLTVMGPVAFYILDNIGVKLLIVYSIVYPIILGSVFTFLGYIAFKKKDLL